ncbi:MAG: glutamate-5-semialdehyde dehydrogenase [Clostridiales bacterium]|nr:glutamate-5-semialdehyde dehydrogenase [Clostridiales bacterium]
MDLLEKIGRQAIEAKTFLACACAGSKQKNRALEAVADALETRMQEIVAANAEDIIRAIDTGTAESFLDRLRLDEKRILGMADGVRQVAALPDPVGRVLYGSERPNGLKIEKVSVPLGVIAIIYEARPNVTSDAAALCLKAGNCVVLRGGKEALSSNKCIAKVMRDALENAGFPADCVQLVEDTDRETAAALMKLNQYIDVLIPRGGAGLIQSVVQNATVPVIETGVGNCHVFVDASADLTIAADIVYNAKTSRPSVCNACETALVHRDIAEEFLPQMAEKLALKNVEIRGDAAVCRVLPQAVPAAEEDWYTEFLDYILAVRIVDSLDEAAAHIAKYSSHHSESIVTSDYHNARRFTQLVDSAAVYVNASTRYTDGGEFGLGAEIGISTQKLHARGPMGLNELTSYKFLIFGDGQIR